MQVDIYEMYVNERRLPYLETVRETELTDETELTNPEKIAETLRNVFSADKLLEEHTWAFCLNTRMQCIGIFEIAKGTQDACILSAGQVICRALLCGANHVIVAHNHPSGEAKPSQFDEVLTKRLKDAGELCDIKLMDHVIVSGARREGYFSFAESKLL